MRSESCLSHTMECQPEVTILYFNIECYRYGPFGVLIVLIDEEDAGFFHCVEKR